MCLISAGVIRRCSALPAISSTSSTPAAAAISSTCSITRCRTSGARIGGSGSDRSSNTIVSRIPGRSSSGSGSLPSGFSSASRIRPFTSRMPGSESGG